MSDKALLWAMGLESIKALEVERGILASGRDEAYGCIFGRDSLIVSLELLESRVHRDYALPLVRKILLNLALLQGREVNIESGEEPGKIIHEYRPEGYEHLVRGNGWYLYPDQVLRNYDTVDATPLFLMAADRYLRAVGTAEAYAELAPAVHAALMWMLQYADGNGDGFVDYQFHPERRGGGLRTQSWMDSAESVFFEEEGSGPPLYPIAPVEVQAYAWAALRAWGERLEASEPALSRQLLERACSLKREFNKAYVLKSGKRISLAFALCGTGRPLTAVRSSMGHVLWAAYRGESILEQHYVEPLRLRLLSRDLFVPKAGIRTLSSRSPHFDPMSYHNGSIWPHDTAMLATGLSSFGYKEDARRVREALLNAYRHFKTPLELFAYRRGLREYQSPSGQRACRVQAWSAASLLGILESTNEEVESSY